MSVTIQVRRGLAANLPSSAAIGELLFATDTGILYIGTGTGIIPSSSAHLELTATCTALQSMPRAKFKSLTFPRPKLFQVQ
jgi:hypothetical protein